MMIVLSLGVTGCATTHVIQNECIWASEINPTNADIDVISDSLVEQILKHNDKYNEFCR